MAICTKCGAIMNKEDMTKHKCFTVPKQGMELIPLTKEETA